MLVSQSELPAIIERLRQTGVYSVDTETTGLRPHHGDRLFSLIIGAAHGTYYFNFGKYSDLRSDFSLHRSSLREIGAIFLNPDSLFIMANAKFDLSMLAMDGIQVAGTVHCTEAIGRVEKNDRFQYGLAPLAKELGLLKGEEVAEYVKKHSLITKISVPAKKKPYEIHHYDQVPSGLIIPYGIQDGSITRSVGLSQIVNIEAVAAKTVPGLPTPLAVMENERRLTKTLFSMEFEGVPIDRAYTSRALALETDRYESAAREFTKLTGTPFSDSNKLLGPIFKKIGVPMEKTPTGRDSVSKASLKAANHPIADAVLTYRRAHKKAGTYYSSFLFFADANDLLHCNFRQGGTGPGRLSCKEPNLQNLHKPDKDSILDPEDDEALSVDESSEVRRCFIPPEDFCFVMIDGDQMEYRLMLDYAQETGVIEQVLGGMDIHAATALFLGVSREYAKTLNFMLIYGGGVKKLAKMLRISLSEAQRYKNLYFSKLPKLVKFVQNVIQTARTRGYIFNWFGRRCLCSDRNFAYALPNHLIQGGCADVMKIGMNRIDDLLKPYRSKQLIQIHDELLLKFHRSELHLVPECVRILENVYPAKSLPLTFSVSHSWRSWKDKVKGYPIDGKEARNAIQGMDQTAASFASQHVG